MRSRILVLAAALLAAGIWATAAAVPPKVTHAPPPMLATIEGAELYAAYCSSCHGSSGHGDGAVASYLAVPPPDLTRIAERHGKFDYLAVRHDIAGVDRAPGSVMPIWSPMLSDTYSSDAREAVILRNLVLHLESMQAATAEPTMPAAAHPKFVLRPVPPLSGIDGAHVYASLCADCHGASGRGDGRLAAYLETPVPDLTLLWVRNGAFDAEQVRDAISQRHMMPLAEADPWWEVMVDSYGFVKGNRMIAGLTQHLEAIQEPR